MDANGGAGAFGSPLWIGSAGGRFDENGLVG
jgi:hypothetical protein